MKRAAIFCAAALAVAAATTAAQGQGWDARQWNVPDVDKPWIEDPPGNWIIDPAYEMTCWQAVATNQLRAAGYEQCTPEVYTQIYNHFCNVPGVPVNASKWWLVDHGRNPDSDCYRPDNTYTDIVVHNTPGLFNPEGPDGPQSDDWPEDGAHAADYNELLDDLNANRYVNIGMCQDLVGGGHALTLVGRNYANSPNGNTSICHDPDTREEPGEQDPGEEPKANTFDPWRMLWTVYYADVLRPGLRKPGYAETNYDVAACWGNAGLLRDAGTHGDEIGWDDYPEPHWVADENAARIHGERFGNRAGHLYFLVDYAAAQASDPQITVTDNDGNEAELVGPVHWSDSASQALLHYRFIHYDRDEQGRLIDARPYQPDFQTIEFPSDDYRDFEHSVIGWDVATFCAAETGRSFYATSDPAGALPGEPPWTDPGGGPPPMANELWFCHSNTYLAGLYKTVDFTLAYMRHEDDPSLTWDETNPALYGAGYYDDFLSPSGFHDLNWWIEDIIAVDFEGNPDEEGDYIMETLHIHMMVAEHPDWEWIKLMGAWDQGTYQTMSAAFHTQWVIPAPPIPEPGGLGLIGLALLAVRKKRN